ncbi:hypothetical protein ILUMI_25463 [Ignelater luminosus]|uniref:Peptidase S1 domain-containing protein n=1 Tax=Ignelater luminosus TaxID=2038154 RepID=A0A8K0C8H9_IGNLU|nr:hypothetical protein ILUMI_25463 [Ignelater luminosus]
MKQTVQTLILAVKGSFGVQMASVSMRSFYVMERQIAMIVQMKRKKHVKVLVVQAAHIFAITVDVSLNLLNVMVLKNVLMVLMKHHVVTHRYRLLRLLHPHQPLQVFHQHQSCAFKELPDTIIVSCSLGAQQLDSCKDAVEGVQAFLRCADLYENSDIENYPFRTCKDGSWDHVFPQCRPICGQKRPDGVPNVIGGENATKGDYPWHVGIYEASSKNNICGGSLISARIVISAAHCFSSLSNGQKYSKDKYLIAAGKYYRNYNHVEDKSAQYSNVDNIMFPPRYKGEINHYEADLAVVILTNPFTFTPRVQPVCVDWTTKFEYQQISGDKRGVVLGWGQTVEGSKPSDVLKELSIPVIPYERCYEQVPPNFRRFITYDKVCAGVLDAGQSTCQGDSGGGLAFKNTNEKYFLRGIVSTSPATRERFCDSNQYGTYTLLSKYIDFIREYL